MKYLITEKDHRILLSNFIKKYNIMNFFLFQKLLRTKKITVNQKIITSNTRLMENDMVVIDYFYEKNYIKKTENNFINPRDDKIVYNNILYSSTDLIILNKPSGLCCQLGSKVKKSIQCIAGKMGYFLVHRLDKNTSGAMVIAKNRNMAIELQKMFLNRQIFKVYITVLQGEINKRVKINKDLQNDNSTHEAITYIIPIKVTDGETLAFVHIKTGRKHQIRKHCTMIGHGLVGDRLYNIQSKSNHMYLHSIFLCFHKYSFTASIDGKFTDKINNFFHIKSCDIYKLLEKVKSEFM